MEKVQGFYLAIHATPCYKEMLEKTIRSEFDFNKLDTNIDINDRLGYVFEAIKKHDIPYNKLHDKGFPSIGCEPCTRAIKPDEDPRAGRWWWSGARWCPTRSCRRGRSEV